MSERYNPGTKGGAKDIRNTDNLADALNDPDFDTIKKDGVEITATAAELSKLAGTDSGLTAAELSILDGVTATDSEINMAADRSANTVVVDSANVITAVKSGTTYILNDSVAMVNTLPLIELGLRFTFIMGETAVSGGNHTIIPNSANDSTIHGLIHAAALMIPGVDEDSVNFVAGKIVKGDRVDLFSDSVNWYIQGQCVDSDAITLTS